MDKIKNEKNVKQKGGSIEYFTNGILNRESLMESGVTVALIPFIHNDHYFLN
jgi:inosine/xanthosine triphosphatase